MVSSLESNSGKSPGLGQCRTSRVHVAFFVDDVDAAFRTAIERGARERTAMVLDPDGYPVEFHNPGASA
jgi:hypothetical protein